MYDKHNIVNWYSKNAQSALYESPGCRKLSRIFQIFKEVYISYDLSTIHENFSMSFDRAVFYINTWISNLINNLHNINNQNSN